MDLGRGLIDEALGGQHFVTDTVRDFAGSELFRIRVMIPAEFLAQVEGKP